ncbi:TRAP transporter large permease [Xanthobacter sp. DSM 24535]|uniref:TRAP transporter large permease n=1 Tax=Roseixanthobacter psychrophilus TaxID=3119917 RepID=UPI003726F4D6
MLPLLVILGMIALLTTGAPVGFSLLIAGVFGLWAKGGLEVALGVLGTAPSSAASAYELITIPMFMLMAEFVILSGIADGLFRSATIWVGRIPGGLGVATTLAGAGFAAISGSSTASAATLSSTTIPAMLKQGYEPKMACGIVAISGTLAMLIPPSIALVLYGIVANVSIGRLLIAGIVPGILVTITIILTILFLVWKDPTCAPVGRAYTWREKLVTLREVGPMITLFVVVTGLIYSGIATPTEASALGAFGALVLAMRARSVTPSSMMHSLKRAAHSTCMILMIILGAQVFGYFITLTQVTQQLVAWVSTLAVPGLVVIAALLLIKMLLGAIMDQAAIIILAVPIVLPVVVSLGYDPIWFGVIMVVTAEVGLVTPPIGLNAFVVARYTGRPLWEVFHGLLPHVIAHLFVIALFVLVPQTVLWLPSTMSR